MAWTTRQVANETKSSLRVTQAEIDIAQKQLDVALRLESERSRPQIVPAASTSDVPEPRQFVLLSNDTYSHSLPAVSSFAVDSDNDLIVVIAMRNIGSGPAFIDYDIAQPTVSGPVFGSGRRGRPSSRAIASGDIIDIAFQAPRNPLWKPRQPSSPINPDVTLEISYTGSLSGLTWTTTSTFELTFAKQLLPIGTTLSQIDDRQAST
jgi:hypothetical protein